MVTINFKASTKGKLFKQKSAEKKETIKMNKYTILSKFDRVKGKNNQK